MSFKKQYSFKKIFNCNVQYISSSISTFLLVWTVWKRTTTLMLLVTWVNILENRWPSTYTERSEEESAPVQHRNHWGHILGKALLDYFSVCENHTVYLHKPTQPWHHKAAWSYWTNAVCVSCLTIPTYAANTSSLTKSTMIQTPSYTFAESAPQALSFKQVSFVGSFGILEARLEIPSLHLTKFW